MNHATIYIFSNQLQHPFPTHIDSIQLISTQHLVALSYINDSAGLKKNKITITDALSLCDRAH